MKKRFGTGRSSKSRAYYLLSLCSIITIVSLLVIPQFANASLVFFDGFEDGDHLGWLVSTTGGTGSTGVTFENNSQMAYVSHTGSSSHAISMDFSYVADEFLSFDMLAVAVPNTYRCDAYGGVTISFSDQFNVEIGSLSFINTTNSSFLGENIHSIDSTQHNYSGTMFDFASYAGLNSTDPISKISLEFRALAQSVNGSINGYPHLYKSSSTVYFDNVAVGAVPIPSAVWFLGSGLVGLAGLRTRMKK